MTAVTLVLCTAPVADAQELADRLLEERLVACVNLIGPVTSRYRWREKIEQGQELILLMKTRSDLAPALRARILELHGYEVPEVLEFEADAGLPAYLDWVEESCR